MAQDDDPLRIHLVAPTGNRNWSTAIAFISARLMRITSGEPVPTERLATYDDTRQVFAD